MCVYLLFYCLQDFKLVNVDLTPKEIIDVLAVDDPNVTDPDGAINLELEVIDLISWTWQELRR